MRILETVALSIWVGAMTAFAFIFAPISFHTIANLDTFAHLISQTITAITYLGFGCGALILTALLVVPRTKIRQRRLLCVLLMLGTSAYEMAVVMPGMQKILLESGGSIAALALHDPHRLAYDAQHHISSLIYGMTLLAGYVALVLRALDTSNDGNALSRQS